MVEISPIFHSSGILVLCRLRLNIFSNGSNIISASSFRSLGCTLSGPGDFAIFNDSIFFLILSFEIFRSFNTASKFLVGTSGISCTFSFVKTLVKNDDSTSAFSLSFAVLLSSPSSPELTRSGIPWRILVLSLTYCQNYLGLHLASFAMLLSLCFLAFFVKFLTWFVSLLYSANFCSDLVSMYLCQHRCFFLLFWIIFDSYGMCCFIPSPLLIILCGKDLSRHAFSISVKWFHMSFTFVAVLAFWANSVVANFLILL